MPKLRVLVLMCTLIPSTPGESRRPAPVPARISDVKVNASVGLVLGPLVNLPWWVDVRMDSDVVHRVPSSRVHEVAAPHEDVANAQLEQ